jgi:elongation factor G
LTGDTLCAPDHPLQLAGLTIPDPVVSLAVEPRSVIDREKLLPALEKLQWEDPTFRVRENPETGQTVLTGMGELHLEIITDRLKREFGVQVKTGRPQVVYRETLTRQSEHREVFIHDIEGKIQGGEINLRLTPLPRGSGIKLSLPDEVAPLTREMLAAVRESLTHGCTAGVQTGYPLTDLEIQVTEIPFQPGVTTSLGLGAAAQRGLVLAGREGKPTLLEPVMALELTVPSEYAGRVIGTLQQKRGKIDGMQMRCEVEVIRARVPLSEMFGYMTELRSATKGRGTYSMEFSHFDLAPPEARQQAGVA